MQVTSSFVSQDFTSGQKTKCMRYSANLGKSKSTDAMDSHSQSMPQSVVPPVSLDDLLPLCLADPCIKIVDFGEAFFPEKYIPQGLGTPPCYASPEVRFRGIVGPASDVWSLACLLKLVSNRFLFGSCWDRDEVLVDMVRTFGKLPDRWWNQWESRAKYFRGGWDPARWRSPKNAVAREAGGAISEFEPEEMVGFERVIHGMVRYEPGERISAQEVERLLQRLWGKGPPG